MDRTFKALNETISKSSINSFNSFLRKYSYVDKWIMCSDYCIGDKQKPNDVISFVLFPYIASFDDMSNAIKSMQKTDLKHCRTVSDDFCSYAHSGEFLGINFILKKDCNFNKWKDKESLHICLSDLKDIAVKWSENTPNCKDKYLKMSKRINSVISHTSKKNYNYTLLSRLFSTVFLASYLKFLLYNNAKYIQVFSWLSDRDDITSFENGIYLDLFHIISHNLISKYCSEQFIQNEYPSIKEVYSSINSQDAQFFDDLNRVADFICGAIADYNYEENGVSAQKHLDLIEKVIADNPYIITIIAGDDCFCRIKIEKSVS